MKSLQRHHWKILARAAANPRALLDTTTNGLMNIGRRCYRLGRHLGYITFQPEGRPRGRVLVSYILDAMLWDIDSTPRHSRYRYHSNAPRTRTIVRTFLDLGYTVDLASNENPWFRPARDYDILFAHRLTFERLADLMGPDCIKIVHLDTADILFHSRAELERLHEVQKRRGVTIPARRLEMPSGVLERADFATLTGNEFTRATYAHSRIPIYLTPTAPVLTYPWPESKNFGACRKRFLFLASEGMVHKGLDLALEAFAGMPEMELVVCGPVIQERQFVSAFRKELYETRNIRIAGWMSTDTVEFVELTNDCRGLVYPSCSEGQAGAVVTSMHAGLIPMVSLQSGVDVGGFGYTFRTCSVEDIRSAVRACASLSPAEGEARSRAAWEFARREHTIESFARTFRHVVESILTSRGMLTREAALDTPVRPNISA